MGPITQSHRSTEMASTKKSGICRNWMGAKRRLSKAISAEKNRALKRNVHAPMEMTQDGDDTGRGGF